MHISILTLCFYKTLAGKAHYVSGGRSQNISLLPLRSFFFSCFMSVSSVPIILVRASEVILGHPFHNISVFIMIFRKKIFETNLSHGHKKSALCIWLERVLCIHQHVHDCDRNRINYQPRGSFSFKRPGYRSLSWITYKI